MNKNRLGQWTFGDFINSQCTLFILLVTYQIGVADIATMWGYDLYDYLLSTDDKLLMPSNLSKESKFIKYFLGK